jgi:hypothetical protein
MPINPKLKHLYPPDWKEISKRIRFERAGGKCEQCGAEHMQPHPVNGNKTVLTVAHLNHNPADNREENLSCLCARCHLAYDHQHHLRNRSKTLQARRIQRILDSGQLELWRE